jgi:predicted glycoside hydrolase/deacetylase ChbG (UPF0249 family)
MTARRIWLCADDYGISASVDAAIRDLVVRGRINATSVMVVAPSFDRAQAHALDTLNAGGRRVAIGLHVTLTAPYRPLSNGFKPLRDGVFHSLDATLIRACLHGLTSAALVAEVAGQLRAFVDHFGRAPDFIDGHQHVHLFPQVRDTVLEVARRDAPNAWVRQCGRAPPLAYGIGDRKGLLLDLLSRGFRRRAVAMGVRTNPAFAGTYDYGERANFAAMFPRFLERMPDGGLIMCHPGFVDAELQRLDPLTTLREQEYAYLIDDGVPDLLARQGVALA